MNTMAFRSIKRWTVLGLAAVAAMGLAGSRPAQAAAPALPGLKGLKFDVKFGAKVPGATMEIVDQAPDGDFSALITRPKGNTVAHSWVDGKIEAGLLGGVKISFTESDGVDGTVFIYTGALRIETEGGIMIPTNRYFLAGTYEARTNVGGFWLRSTPWPFSATAERNLLRVQQ